RSGARGARSVDRPRTARLPACRRRGTRRDRGTARARSDRRGTEAALKARRSRADEPPAAHGRRSGTLRRPDRSARKKSRRRRRGAAGELTPTEHRIALLASRGDTNREIAAQMFITVKTVEANLSRIYGKVGVRSRTQLASRIEPNAEEQLGLEGD